MEKYIIHSSIIVFIYLLFKFAEMRIINKDKEKKPIKEIMRELIIVFLSSTLGLYIIDEFIQTESITKTVTNVFTDHPEF